MKYNLNNMTKEEFGKLELRYNGKDIFNMIVIIPTEEQHDSGYRIMKFAFFYKNEYVGSVRGMSDVLHFNGIGNYGDYNHNRKGTYSIDCLNESGYIRIMIRENCYADEYGISDFSFYIKEEL